MAAEESHLDERFLFVLVKKSTVLPLVRPKPPEQSKQAHNELLFYRKVISLKESFVLRDFWWLFYFFFFSKCACYAFVFTLFDDAAVPTCPD